MDLFGVICFFFDCCRDSADPDQQARGSLRLWQWGWWRESRTESAERIPGAVEGRAEPDEHGRASHLKTDERLDVLG